MGILELGVKEYPVDYHKIAVDAANCHRAIDALLDELDSISPENPQGIKVIERFLTLHTEFYGYVLILTSEDTGIIDDEFKKEVQEEIQRLKAVVEYLKKEKGFLETLTGKVIGRSNQMADFFAQCVADIFEGYGIDDKTNEIYWVYD